MHAWKYTILALTLAAQVTTSESYTGEILQGPATQVVAPNTNVTFTCHARGVTEWCINGTKVTWQNEAQFEDTGFHFSGERLNNNPREENLTLTFVASPGRNNTEIACSAYGTVPYQQDIVTVKVIIAGPPLPPSTPTVEALNTTALTLSWEAPFTWSEFPILGYIITVMNMSTNQVIESILTSELSIIFEPESCHKLQFNVAASNALGNSTLSTIIGGLLTFPSPFTMPVNCTPYFKPDLTPQVQIMFKLPEVCSFQTATYLITVEKEGSSERTQLGPTSYALGHSGQPVTAWINSGLQRDQLYSVVVTMETEGGNFASNTSFDTAIQYPTAAPRTNHTVECQGTTSNPTATTASDEESQGNPTVTHTTASDEKVQGGTKIIGATVGTSVVALLVVGIIFILLFLRQKHKKKSNANTSAETGKKPLPPMVTNPIYVTESPVYETIDVPPLKSKDPRYFNFPPQPPPKTRTLSQVNEQPGNEKETVSENIQGAFHKKTGSSNECYMVMSSAGTISRQTTMSLSPYDIGGGPEYITMTS